MSTRWKQQYHSAGHSKGDVHEAAQKMSPCTKTWPRGETPNLCRRPALGRMTGREGRTRHELVWMSSTKKRKNISTQKGTIAGSKWENSRVTKDWSPFAWNWTRSDSWWADCKASASQGDSGGVVGHSPESSLQRELLRRENNQYLVQYHVPLPAEAAV